MSEDEIGFSNYPPACSGWLYLISNSTAATLLQAATGAKYFWIDDVWVTGFLAGDLNITHLDMIEVQIRALYNKAVAMKGLTLSLLHLPFAFAFCILHFEFKFPAKIWIA